MPSPAELVDDIVDEILLRFPPGEPERLARAALVCKRWCRLIAGPAFRRRFRELHRTPPMLGFFYTRLSVTHLVPTSSIPLPHAFHGKWGAVEARHGRVLFHRLLFATHLPMSERDLIVWDPITDEQWELPKLPEHVFPFPCSWTAALLCATVGCGCNNLDCHRGSFIVVFLCTCPRRTFTCVYSWEAGVWSEPASTELRRGCVNLAPSVLVGNALYYISGDGRRSNKILKHDLGTQETSLIRLPRTPYRCIVLTATVDGQLGFVAVHESKLYLWTREPRPKAYGGWAQSRVVELDTPLGLVGTLPASTDVVCFVDGIAAIFRGADDVHFTIDLKSGRVRKICQGIGTYNVVPYMSFYTPALRAASTVEGPRAGASIA